ncbi:MAG: hypothetical protein P1U85_22725 [Verrucomicrobiales bacterium]|nr:hypothetical protein [Verrucomicrobiales bacterium]
MQFIRKFINDLEAWFSKPASQKVVLNHAHTSSFAAFALGSMVLTGFYLMRPHYNHDLSGYMGVVLGYEQNDPELLHQEVFDLIEEKIPPHRYERLAGLATDSAPSIRAAYDDPEAFRQTLPFYRVRVVYTGTIYGLYKLGVDPVFASHAISAASVLLTMWVCAFMFPGRLHSPYRILFLFGCLGIGLHDLARYSTPDALGTLGWCLVFYLFLRSRSQLLIIVPILIGIRSDYILLAGLLLAYLFITGCFARWSIVLSGIISLLIYFTLQAAWGYSWLQQMHCTYHLYTIKSSYLETREMEFTAWNYFELLENTLASSFAPTFRFIYIYLIMIACSTYWIMFAPKSFGDKYVGIIKKSLVLSILGFLYTIGHIIVIPRLDERYFTFIYLFAVSLLIHLICIFIKSHSDQTDTAS